MVSPSRADWVLFVLLTIMWGSAFELIGRGLKDLPPEAVVAGRLILAAALLYIIMRLRGERLPPLRDRYDWGVFVAMGLAGSVIPFLAISHAEQTVSPSLAALFMAATPIIVAAGAQVFFHDEKLSFWSALGIAIGFGGMVYLAGPETLRELVSGEVSARALLLLAATGYATATLIARAFSPHVSPIAFTTGFVGVAALVSLIPLIWADWTDTRLRAESLLAVAGLGIFPSALAQVGYVHLVRRAGANFLALTNYTIPIWAGLLGWFMGDRVALSSWIAFAVILAGVWLARTGSARARRRLQSLSPTAPSE